MHSFRARLLIGRGTRVGCESSLSQEGRVIGAKEGRVALFNFLPKLNSWSPRLVHSRASQSVNSSKVTGVYKTCGHPLTHSFIGVDYTHMGALYYNRGRTANQSIIISMKTFVVVCGSLVSLRTTLVAAAFMVNDRFNQLFTRLLTTPC